MRGAQLSVEPPKSPPDCQIEEAQEINTQQCKPRQHPLPAHAIESVSGKTYLRAEADYVGMSQVPLSGASSGAPSACPSALSFLLASGEF